MRAKGTKCRLRPKAENLLKTKGELRDFLAPKAENLLKNKIVSDVRGYEIGADTLSPFVPRFFPHDRWPDNPPPADDRAGCNHIEVL